MAKTASELIADDYERQVKTIRTRRIEMNAR